MCEDMSFDPSLGKDGIASKVANRPLPLSLARISRNMECGIEQTACGKLSIRQRLSPHSIDRWHGPVRQ
jgi:hypothetical protein